jgi:filamentous hemagglutinin
VGAGFNLASSLPGLGDAFAAGKIATAAVGVAVAKSASHAVSSTAATAAKVEAAVVTGARGEASLAERILSAERSGTALSKSDATHRAASFLTKEQLQAGQTFTIKGGDGVTRELLQTPGGLNGKSGIFEYILDPTKGVTHQRFIEGGKITGFPNQ